MAPLALGIRQRLVVGALLLVFGLALVGTSHPDAGGVAVLAAWVLIGASLHAFGRSSF